MPKLMVGMKYASTDVKVWLKLSPRERELDIQEPSPHVSILSFNEKVSGESEICTF